MPEDLDGKFSLPLKLGLILASYPEVLPISLSRKSEGDIGLGAERAASASLEAARLRSERGKQWVNDGPVILCQPCPDPRTARVFSAWEMGSMGP